VTTVDIRGEPCGLPVIRVERVLKDGQPFAVLGDQEQTMDQLRLLAMRHGWTCEVSKEGADWKAEFKPA
jgi:TusA-related sulfurtransferase